MIWLSAAGCSHGRAPDYFTESITSRTAFTATKCADYNTWKLGRCSGNPQTSMGLSVSTSWVYLFCLWYSNNRTNFLIYAVLLVNIFWIPTPKLLSHLVNHLVREDSTLKQHYYLQDFQTLLAFAMQYCVYSLPIKVRSVIRYLACHSPLYQASSCWFVEKFFRLLIAAVMRWRSFQRKVFTIMVVIEQSLSRIGKESEMTLYSAIRLVLCLSAVLTEGISCSNVILS
jgi:hypothetical protein